MADNSMDPCLLPSAMLLVVVCVPIRARSCDRPGLRMQHGPPYYCVKSIRRFLISRDST